MKDRRNLVMGIGISLPAIWITPTVSSIVLPAHAQTTDNDGEPTTGTTPEPTTQPPMEE